MIVSDSFVWLHLPKTGGTSTAALFSSLDLPNIVVDDRSTDAKHDSIDERFDSHGLSLGAKKIFLTIRRLPYWLVSDWRHKRDIMGLDLPFDPVRSGLFYSLRLGGVWVAADYWLRYFNIEACTDVIRLEYLNEDANKYIYPLLPKNTSPLSFPRINRGSDSIGPVRFFRRNELRTMYNNNPVWKHWETNKYSCTCSMKGQLSSLIFPILFK